MQSGNRFIEALLKGDSVVISEIYERFFPKVLQFILQNKGCHARAKDVFQESLISIILAVRERGLEIDNFEAYLFTVSKNMWRRELEKQKKWVIKDKEVALVDKDTDMAMFAVEQKRFELYQEQYDQLSENCKELLSLFFNGVSYQEIIKEFSYATINTARQRIFKCRSKLMKLIKSKM